ncbi:MAG: DUF998 domain-containing protein [Methanobrevibacter sp.]|nr:DUF998 domain-containing protein [Methanobrevibacter sp.]
MSDKKRKLNLYNKCLILCGVIAGLFFTISWIIQGAFREGYNPVMAPVSSLSIGPVGWIQVATFLITGVLIVFFAYGLLKITKEEKEVDDVEKEVIKEEVEEEEIVKEEKNNGIPIWGPILLLVCGIGLIGAGCFTTDTTTGYSEAKAIVKDNPSFSGPIHKFFAGFLFFGLPLATFIFGNYFSSKNKKNWMIYSFLTGILFLIMFFITMLGYLIFDGFRFYSGLFQRITLSIGALWLILISIYFLKE